MVTESYKMKHYVLVVIIALLFLSWSTSSPAADYTWGGAGTQAAPIAWDSASNAQSDHWGVATAPDTSVADSVLIPTGGLTRGTGGAQSNGWNIENGNTVLQILRGIAGAQVRSHWKSTLAIF